MEPKRRGRPPKADAMSPAERQRAYRERRALATPEVATFVRMREDLHAALLRLELRTEDVVRLEARCIQLERDLKELERHHLNRTKDLILMRRKLAERR
jgi:hypothetical protein